MTIKKRKLKKYFLNSLPLIHFFAMRMKLRQRFSRYIHKHGNEKIDPVDTLLLLIYNLTRGKIPLYELEDWTENIDFHCIGMKRPCSEGKLNDDRFGKALDKLYYSNRASLMTEIVITYIEEFQLEIQRLHNDSTTVKAFGKITGTTRSGLELRKGNSKDHRPDLKQLVFNLSITADGAVPIYHKCYEGNRTDDKTHIETWNILNKINRKSDFLYVGDSKLCTDEQLNYIVKAQGRVITIIPETWTEVTTFKESLKITKKSKRIIWRRLKPGKEDELEYFSVFNGTYTTQKRGYLIHWIYSSEKKKRDRSRREELLTKAETELSRTNAKINTGKLKTSSRIKKTIEAILDKYKVKGLIRFEIKSTTEKQKIQVGKGRPCKKTKYKIKTILSYTLTWGRDRKALKLETRIDGIFPLLCTDDTLSSKEVLKAYKYQPKLEKRFAQFKSIHNAAPLLFKKIERVEANMFAFFIALAIQSLLEREIRKKMKEEGIEKLLIYPEERKCKKPTASIIFDRFDHVCKYEIEEDEMIIEKYCDELTQTQLEILHLVRIPENQYWNCSF